MKSIVSLSLLLVALLANDALGQSQTASFGINLSGPADWNTELPFVDVFRMSRPWISQREGAPWGKGPPLEIDELGWVTSLADGCFAESMLCTIGDGHYPGGIYHVFYEGDGELAFGGSAKIVAQQPGRIQIEVNPDRGGFSLQIRRTNPKDHVRNIHVIMPGFEDTWQNDPFHPTFVDRWRGMACVRFMDWMHTNDSEVATWTERPTLEHATFSRHGVAIEWMVDLCDHIDAAPWFCMPHRADDDYIRRFATLVFERMDPDRKVYIEYSNEVWNGQFEQHHYAAEQGAQLGIGPADRPWEAAWHYTAVRSLQIFAIWEDVFGGHDRLVRVLPSQAANPHVSEQVLSFRDAYKSADALAIAPYMAFTVGRGRLSDADDIADWDVDQLLDVFEQQSLPEAVERMKASKKVADKYGVELIAYEAGQHMVSMARDQTLTEKLTATMQEANRHPRMGQIYDQYFAAWGESGGGILAHFSSISKWSRYGSWGLMQFYDDSAENYPKFAAAIRWARKLGQDIELDE